MTPERWQEVERLYHAALSHAEGDRVAFLSQECAGDDALRREVESLLAQASKAGGFLDAPALEITARALAADSRPSLLGRTFGPYSLLSLLGAGGMGEVYRATDTKLGRDVALKFLPDTVTHDPERLARFRREAQVLAALNHPHIGAIYGLDEANGLMFLVLELVDGESLDRRIARGPIPSNEALPIARQIAEALEAAHEKGIIHRDLKPANIALTKDGEVKVLDFGLARATDAASHPSLDPAISPTLTSPAMMTGAGMILGTAAYMAPEQAKGTTVDRRADIWAFGVVLYEMLAGERAFKGDHVSETLASVLKDTPSFEALPAGTPPRLTRLLKRCLDRDVRMRLRDIGEARVEIARIEAGAPDGEMLSSRVPAAPHPLVARALPWAVAAGGLIAAAAILTLWAPWQTSTPRAVLRVTVDLGADASLVSVNGPAGAAAVLSPDGALLAFVAQQSGATPQLYLRRLDQLKATLLSGTEDAASPFFSPDGQWIGFFAGAKLKKVSVSGGAAVTLCDAPSSRGGAWAEDGNIVLQPVGSGRLMRVSSGGGRPEPLTTSADGDATQRWPQVLPGGRAVIYTSSGSTGNYADADIVVQPLPNGARKVLVHGGYFGRYAPSGHLLYLHDSTVFVAPFDVRRLELTGQPVPEIQDVISNINNGAAQMALSNSGTLAYMPGDIITSQAPIVWLDRHGKTAPLRPTPTDWSNLQFSPDGQRLAMDLSDGNIWIYDWVRDTFTRLTLDAGDHRIPVWAPDGRRIAFRWAQSGTVFNLFWRRVDGSGDVVRLTTSPNPQFPQSWHPSGKFLAFGQINPNTGYDVMLLPVDGDDASGWRIGTPAPFANGPVNEFAAAFSPDGKWLAYQSNESGRDQVYVRPFPGSGGKWVISTDGGTFPVWSRARTELLYAAPDNRIMVASYAVHGDSFAAEKPRAWADARFLPRRRGAGFSGRPFDLHPDGERVAIAPAPENDRASQQAQLVFVFNFFDELRRQVPTKH